MDKISFISGNNNIINNIIHTNLRYNKKYCFNFLNAYSVYLFRRNEMFRDSLINGSKHNYNFVDSFYVSLILKIKYLKKINRLQGPNFTEYFISNKELTTNKKLFFIGFENKDLDYLTKKYKLKRNNLQAYNPPYIKESRFSDTDQKTIIDLINKSKSDYVFIGVGNPKQEILANDIIGKINIKGIFNVGAAFDFITDKKKRSPSIYQKIGLEWLYRLITNYKYIRKRIIPTIKGVIYTFRHTKYKTLKI